MYEKQYGVLNNAQMNNIEALDARNAEIKSQNQSIIPIEGISASVVNNIPQTIQQNKPYIQNSLSSINIPTESFSNENPQNNMARTPDVPVPIPPSSSVSNGVQNPLASENVLPPPTQPPLSSVGPIQSYPVYQQPVYYTPTIPAQAPVASPVPVQSAQSEPVPSQVAEISQLPTFLRSDTQNSVSATPLPVSSLQPPVTQTPNSNIQFPVQSQLIETPQSNAPVPSILPQPVQQAPPQPVPDLIPFAQPPQYPGSVHTQHPSTITTHAAQQESLNQKILLQIDKQRTQNLIQRNQPKCSSFLNEQPKLQNVVEKTYQIIQSRIQLLRLTKYK